MEFTFIAPAKTIFKSGALESISQYIDGYGKKFLIVVDHVLEKHGILAKLQKQLDYMGIAYDCYLDVLGEPDVTNVDDASAKAVKSGCDVVLSIGGGSVIDVGKAVAGVATNGGYVKEYLEFVGTGRKVVNPPLPFIAIPTTAGAGAEVTKNAVIGSKKEHFKRSMRDDQLMAKLCIIDPMLCVSAPPKVTAISGIDAITHLMEAYVIKKANPMTKSLALQGIDLAGRYLRRVYDNGNDLEAREGMSLAAYLGGISFSNSGLGAAHGLGMVINIYHNVPHGYGVGITLPYVMEINAKYYPTIYDEVGEVFAGKRFTQQGEGTEVAIRFIKDLNAHIGIPADLKELGLTNELAETMGRECFGSSMSGNPVQLNYEEWKQLFMELM